MMIGYKLWYVSIHQTHVSSGAHHEGFCRGYRTSILKTPGPSKRKGPVQTILVLLVESGLVFLGIQVSYFSICLLICPRKIVKVLTFLTDSVLVGLCVQCE